jgi:uncharacterized Zn finger protein
VGERRRQAARKLARMKKDGREVSPVEIAVTFWGGAWCRNLESYSDYSNRLPRGRTYVRNGSVIDLRIEAGRACALVSGSDIYEVEIGIEPLANKRWKSIKKECTGQIGSLVELLRGSISSRVMEIVTRKGEGLFPSPREISLECSCPDWAAMCKHVAAVLYGVGARLDRVPELLFTLRGVDPADMVEAVLGQSPPAGKGRSGRVLDSRELSSVFGIDIDMGEGPAGGPARRGSPAVGTKRRTRGRSTAVEKPPRKASSVKRKTAPRKAAAKMKPGAVQTARKVPAKPAPRKPPAGSGRKTAVSDRAREKEPTPVQAGQPLERIAPLE